jgi:biofilm PGA synthesis N-glycosyltransferase PgaC
MVMSTQQRYVVVTPVRDEIAHVELTIESVLKQTLRPAQWIVVDDGSADGTSVLLDALAAPHPWITVVHRTDRGFRAAGGGVVDAFYAGFALVETAQWAFIAKLDGDLSFAPDYFERCLEHFSSEPGLGIGGGTVCSNVTGDLRIDSAGDPPFHVRGATKIYRRSCWNQIAPLIRAPGWDTLDEVKANFFGWRTRTFPELKIVQHKPTGSADGLWANAFKNGRANYLTGYHPAFMVGKCIHRACRRPFGIESAGLFAGFISGYFERLPRLADAETIRYLRGQQVKRLMSRPSIYGQLS